MIDVIRKNGGYYDTFNQFDYYPIYPSFQETIAILKQCGTEVGSKVTPENTEKIVLQYQGGKIPEDQLAPADTELGKRQREYLQNNSRREVTITDPEQIQKFLQTPLRMIWCRSIKWRRHIRGSILQYMCPVQRTQGQFQRMI